MKMFRCLFAVVIASLPLFAWITPASAIPYNPYNPDEEYPPVIVYLEPNGIGIHNDVTYRANPDVVEVGAQFEVRNTWPGVVVYAEGRIGGNSFEFKDVAPDGHSFTKMVVPIPTEEIMRGCNADGQVYMEIVMKYVYFDGSESSHTYRRSLWLNCELIPVTWDKPDQIVVCGPNNDIVTFPDNPGIGVRNNYRWVDDYMTVNYYVHDGYRLVGDRQYTLRDNPDGC